MLPGQPHGKGVCSLVECFFCVSSHFHTASFPLVFKRYFFVASSSKGFAVLSSMVNAPVGHSPVQSPKPSQKFSLTSFALPFTICNAPSEQAVTQLPQPLQNSSFILIITLFISASLS